MNVWRERGAEGEREETALGRGERERERERDRDRDRDRQTDRQSDRQTDRKTDRQTEMNRFKGNVGETSERLGGAHIYHLELN